MYRQVQFNYSGRNEWKYDENEEPVMPGAKSLAERVVAEIVKEGGMLISSVEQQSYYGWGFSMRFGGCSFCHVLNPVDEIFMTIELKWYLLKLIFGLHPKRTFDRYCQTIEKSLGTIREVTDVVWKDISL